MCEWMSKWIRECENKWMNVCVNEWMNKSASK